MYTIKACTLYNIYATNSKAYIISMGHSAYTHKVYIQYHNCINHNIINVYNHNIIIHITLCTLCTLCTHHMDTHHTYNILYKVWYSNNVHYTVYSVHYTAYIIHLLEHYSIENKYLYKIVY